MADGTGVSMDWLLFGVGGNLPVYVGQQRPTQDLEEDIAIYVRREIHRREAEGAFDTPDGHSVRLGLEHWLVDGAGLLAGLIRDEERRVKDWILWEGRTEALEGIADDLLTALRSIVPYLPADNKELGRAVYSLGRAAAEARDLRSALEGVDEPNSYRDLTMRFASGPSVGPKKALEFCESELSENGDDQNPLSRRIQAGTARLAPRTASGQ